MNITGVFAVEFFENSFLLNRINEIGLKYNKFDLTGLEKLRKSENIFSLDWNSRVAANYIDTLAYANKVSQVFTTGVCPDNSRFRAFYQPYNVPERLKPLHQQIRLEVQRIPFVHDISTSLDGKQEVFTDIVHVNQIGNEILAHVMYEILLNDTAIRSCIETKLS